MEKEQEQLRRIRFVIIEDDQGLALAIRDFLKFDPRFECLGVYFSAEDALASISLMSCDIVLMDIMLTGGMSGIECTHYLSKNAPNASILMLSNVKNEDIIVDAVVAGAKGYMNKLHIFEELIPALLAVWQGGSYLSPEITRKVMQQIQGVFGTQLTNEGNTLSRREVSIMQKIRVGKSYQDIADMLSISPKTVQTHVRNIYKKMGVSTQKEAVSKVFKVK